MSSFILFCVSLASFNKFVCESDEGKNTIMYSDSTIIGYTAKEITFNMINRKKAKRMGIDEYISRFTIWFETNTIGICSIKEK